MVSIFEAFVLGVVQGFTEFLPISSSAHLVLLPWLTGWKDPGLAFDVFLHLGTLFALLVYFRKDWWALIRAGLFGFIGNSSDLYSEKKLFWMMIWGTLPALLAGYLFHDLAATSFRSPLLISVTLAVVGFLLYWVDENSPQLKEMRDLGYSHAFLIGLAQAFAIIPGVSRSGATMLMGRWVALRREVAAKFSFLMAVPILMAACAHEVPQLFKEMNSTQWPIYVSGFLGSLLFGFLAIHFLLQFLRVSNFAFFAWYRVGLAAVIVLLHLI